LETVPQPTQPPQFRKFRLQSRDVNNKQLLQTFGVN